MIGVARRIIIFDDNGTASVMFNPEIIKSSGPYEAEEGCRNFLPVLPGAFYCCLSNERSNSSSIRCNLMQFLL